MTQKSLLNTNWNSGDEISASALNDHGQAHLDLDGHGDAFHSEQYLKALVGGDGIDPDSIGDGDPPSVAWGDANDLDADGNVTSGGGGGISSLTGGTGILPSSIGDGDTLDVDLAAIAGDNLSVDATNNELDASAASGITSLSGGDGISPGTINDGDPLSVAWGDAGSLDSAGRVNDFSAALDLNSSGALLTDSLTVAGNSVALGGSTDINHRDLSSIQSDDHHTKTTSASELSDVSADSASSAHHQEPTAGTGITDEGTNQFGIASGGVSDTELGVDAFVYDPGMTEFEDGLSDESINRLELLSNESLVIERIEFRQKGGGSSSSASIAVFDANNGNTMVAQNLGGTTKDSGISGVNSTIVITVTNSTGSTITAAPRVQGYIRGA